MIKKNIRLSSFIINKNFFKLWVADSISIIGDYIYSINLSLWIYKITGSALALTNSMIFQFLPKILFSPFIGALIDNISNKSKKTILILSDIIRAAFLVLLLFIVSKDYLIIIYIISFINSLISLITKSTKSTILPLILTNEDIVKGNSLRNFSESLISVCAPIFSALLSLFSFKGIILIDIVSFLISAIILSTLILPLDKLKINRVREMFSRKEFFFIVDTCRKKPIYRNLLVINFGMALAQGGINVLFYSFLLKVIKLNNVQFGVVLSVQGIGSVIGSLIVIYYSKMIKFKYLISIPILLSGISILIYTTYPQFYIMLICSFVEGVIIMSVFISIPSFLQSTFKNNELGKAFTIMDVSESIGLFLSMSICGVLLKLLTLTSIFYMLAIIYIITFLFSYFSIKEK